MTQKLMSIMYMVHDFTIHRGSQIKTKTSWIFLWKLQLIRSLSVQTGVSDWLLRVSQSSTVSRWSKHRSSHAAVLCIVWVMENCIMCVSVIFVSNRWFRGCHMIKADSLDFCSSCSTREERSAEKCVSVYTHANDTLVQHSTAVWCLCLNWWKTKLAAALYSSGLSWTKVTKSCRKWDIVLILHIKINRVLEKQH